MANMTTVALTYDQYKEIIETMRTGGVGFRPNERIAAALILEANLGIRISDIMALTPKSIIKDGNRYRLNIKEKKTKKKRPFTVPTEVYTFIQDYCARYSIKTDDLLFPFTIRNVQKYLNKVADYLGYENVSTHSFRKFFGSDIWQKNEYNIILVQRIFQHSSPAITQAYLGISTELMEKALAEHVVLV